MESSNGGEEQCGRQTSLSQPFHVPSKHTRSNKDIVSRRVSNGVRILQGGWTYNIREPSPYWPDTGHAHTTCKYGLAVALAAVAFRTTSVFISDTEESAGMACRLSAPQPRRVLDTPESSVVYPTFVQSRVKLLFRHAVLFSLCSLAQRMVCRER